MREGKRNKRMEWRKELKPIKWEAASLFEEAIWKREEKIRLNGKENEI